MDVETNTSYRVGPVPALPRLCYPVFEALPLPIATMAGTRHIVSYVNPAFCRLTGKSPENLIGTPFGTIMPEDGCLSLLDSVYRSGAAETYSEPRSAAAQTMFWSYVAWPILGEDERPMGVVFQVTETARFHRQASEVNQELLLSGLRQHELVEAAERLNAQLQLEMTGRKRMEQALLKSEKLAATGRLAATIAHEINNPLAAITNLIYLLAPLQTNTEARVYIATLGEQVKNLTRISTQMLKFHRDNNHPAEFKLGEVLRETSNFYRLQAGKKGIALIERLETEGSITGFRGEITQLFTNLLLNALDATPADGKVIVHLYPAPAWVCEAHQQCGYLLTVADRGSGVDPRHQARIFEPFFTTKGEKGSGLGLWLCMSIISRVGGSIRVRSSRRPGRSGTCFSVFLPTDKAAFTPLRRKYERKFDENDPD